MTDLERTRSEYEAAKSAYLTARDKYHEALCAAYPFQPGDVIKSTDGAIARVERVTVEYGIARADAVMQNKDGNFGRRKASLWHREWAAPERITL